ncbi:hypothetical protein W02_38200 [Nitrospira sp. KM1]|uniref:hypothetical protein n=1 Tax=Nitrospira sp. KM1 TaxID=1936990 RepID=UPI0013A7A7C5|nr:hypothetical protein [Nitrospira sp. KM1]BCA56680.1 hypothetical protein W02_38200 [Nitrospira sp. KM1]
MLFDPDAGLTLEEKIVRVWHRMNPALKAQYEELSEHTGIPIWDLLIEALDIFLAKMEDPKELQALIAKCDRDEAPFGRDPLLEKGR